MFGNTGFLEFGDTPAEFIAAIETALRDDDPERQVHVDNYLAMQSWDRTWSRMQALMARSMSTRPSRATSTPHGLGFSLPTGGVMPIQVSLP